MINQLFKRRASLLLTLGFVFYLAISWWLFFREEIPILIFSLVYSRFAGFLINGRVWLVAHYLNSLPTAVFIALVIFFLISYGYSLRAKISLRKVVFLALFFQILVFFSYPFLSNDIYDYINSDRLSAVYHQNVWQVPPSKFPNDTFYALINYPNFVRIYGPVNQAIYNTVTGIAGDDILVNLAFHKLVVVFFVAACLFLTLKILREYYPQNPSFGIKLVFWNPLFVLETAGSGHNDIIMLFFLLLAFYFFKSRKSFLAGASLALSVQIKTSPLLLLPFLGLFFIRENQIRSGLKFALGFIGVYFLTFTSMGVSLQAVLERQNLTTESSWQSLPFLVANFLPILNPALKITLVALLVYQLARVWRGEDPWLAYLETLFLYLLFLLPALWNWYFLWLLVFLPYIPIQQFTGAVLGATFGSLFAYPASWLRLRINYHADLWQVIMYLSILLTSILGWSYVQKKSHWLIEK